ncbi:MAG: PEP-CTERM system TPR-repeat protein PrsT [Gammaproteobacteria bacterium HGW-Gammaproteobacteria-15]|nr:MAG: PEP-CTERM system TPR-repeat protein PrsT [Gammaproteobacteria bacterium HGW-Gammaproteobacteria-15]
MKKTTLLASAVMLALLSGCGSKDATEHYSDALSFIQNKQYSAAVIELKSAVQQEPENAEYRLALGLLQLQIGDSISAEKELARALSYGTDKQKVALPLVRSSYQAGDYQAVLAHFSDETLPPEQQVYIDVYRALAQLELGDAEAAIALFDQLATQNNFSDAAIYAQAHLLIANRNNSQALEIINQVQPDSLLYAEALFLQGRTQLAEEQHAASIESMRNYLTMVPNNLQARLMLTQNLVSTEQFDLADKELALLLKAFPNQPFTNYLKAVLEYERENYTLAKEHVEKAINNGLRNTSARIIAALASLHLGLESQTLNHLSAIQNQLPQYPPLQNLYASLQLKSGQLDQAQAILVNQDPQAMDYKLLAATSFQLIKQGSGSAAQELIAKYELSENSKDVASMTTLGLLKMGIDGQESSGLRDLEQALQLDPSQSQTRVVLAISYLRQKEYDKASAIVDEWLTDEKLAVVGYNLKAYGAMLQKQFDEAEVFLQQAQQATPDQPFTLLLQALVAGTKSDFVQAKQLLVRSIEKHPTYLPALQQYYALSKDDDKGADAIKRAGAILKDNPGNNALRLTLARMHYQQQDFKKAIEVIGDPSVNMVNATAAYWLTLIDSHAQLGNQKEVLALSERWYQQEPENLRAAYFYATSLSLAKRHAEAINVADKQLVKHPKNPMLLRSKIMALSESKDYTKALDSFKNLTEQDAATAEMQFLKGRVLFLNGQIPPAITAFNQSYQLAPTDQTAMFIAEIYSKDYSHQRAVEFLEGHFSKNQASGNLKLFYANLLLESDKKKAFGLYDEILQASPDNYIILNNYAWILAEQNQLPEAKQHIEKAIKQAPKHPDVLDTYGKVLMKMDNLPDAIKAFEQSLAIRPENDLVKLNYAEALVRSDNKSKAKTVLANVKSRDAEIIKRVDAINSML